MNLVPNIELAPHSAFSRWGDGEWNCILNPSTKKYNADHHYYYPELSQALQDVLLSKPKYHIGMLQYALDKDGERINQWLKDRALDLQWSDAEVFHKEVYENRWGFFHTLQKANYLYVGPGHLKAIFPRNFIEVATFNCWKQTQQILDAIRERVHKTRPDVVGFSCGMPSKVWIDMLHKEGLQTCLIDYGSVFDPLGNVRSRGYHKWKDYNLPEGYQRKERQ